MTHGISNWMVYLIGIISFLHLIIIMGVIISGICAFAMLRTVEIEDTLIDKKHNMLNNIAVPIIIFIAFEIGRASCRERV